MNEATGKALVVEYQRYGDIFNRLTELSYKIADVDVRSKVRRAAAEANLQLYEGLVRPVIELYPYLDPDKGDDRA